LEQNFSERRRCYPTAVTDSRYRRRAGAFCFGISCRDRTTGGQRASAKRASVKISIQASALAGVVVACLLHAMQEAGVGLDARIADFWPEFAQGGKREITLGQLLSHRSGLCALSDSTLQMLDKDGIVSCIEKQHPLLPPNAGPAYSPNLIGYALEEILRRLTGGETLSEYWRRIFGDPLGIELWIGLPESENVRVAAIRVPQRGMLVNSDVLFARAIADPYSCKKTAYPRSATGTPPPCPLLRRCEVFRRTPPKMSMDTVCLIR